MQPVLVKEQIEHLIGTEILKRDQQDRSIIIYVPSSDVPTFNGLISGELSDIAD